MAACQVDFADSFGPQTTVMPGASASSASMSAPKASAYTASTLMSRNLEIVAPVESAETSDENALFLVAVESGVANQLHKLSLDGGLVRDRIEIVGNR